MQFRKGTAGFVGRWSWIRNVTLSRAAPSTARDAGADLRSKPEKIAHLHEKLPAGIDVSAWRGQQKAGDRVEWLVGGQVVQVAVVADIDRGARVHQVRDQKVGIELLRGRQVG